MLLPRLELMMLNMVRICAIRRKAAVMFFALALQAKTPRNPKKKVTRANGASNKQGNGTDVFNWLIDIMNPVNQTNAK